MTPKADNLARKATDNPPPSRDTPRPFPYQEEAIQWLMERPKALLALDMGLGKTLSSVMAAARLGLKSVLIICPAVMKHKWVDEVRRWGGPHIPCRAVGLGDNLELFDNWVVVSFQALSLPKSPITRDLLDAHWDLVIVDEAHLVKTSTSNRTKTLYGPRLNGTDGVIQNAQRVWLLTGTPARNHLGEVYTHLRALIPEHIQTHNRPMTEDEFLDRFTYYRITQYGRQITGSKSIPAFKKLIDAAGFVLRKRKQDVLKDLPDLMIDSITVPFPGGMESVASALERQILPPDSGVKTSEDLLAHLASQNAHLATARRELGLIKAEPTAEYAQQILDDSDEKLIIFAVHHLVLDRLAHLLAGFNPVKIDGRTPEKVRQAAIQNFQNDPDSRVFLGQIDACGTGIDLTAASTVLIAEPSWAPADNAQAIARAHRIGQTNKVHAYFITLPTQLDRVISRALVTKAQTINQVF